MRFRLLRRRLTISAPRMAVRSALPWPFRWAMIAIVLGFCGAIALWAFEFGKGIAGVDGNAEAELVQLRADVLQLRNARDEAKLVSNISESQLTTEKATQVGLKEQVHKLEAENQALRDDLAFLQTLMPLVNKTTKR